MYYLPIGFHFNVVSETYAKNMKFVDMMICFTDVFFIPCSFLLLSQITHMSFLRPDGHNALTAEGLELESEGKQCVYSVFTVYLYVLCDEHSALTAEGLELESEGKQCVYSVFTVYLYVLCDGHSALTAAELLVEPEGNLLYFV